MMADCQRSWRRCLGHQVSQGSLASSGMFLSMVKAPKIQAGDSVLRGRDVLLLSAWEGGWRLPLFSLKGKVSFMRH